MKKATLTVEINYDPDKTDPEAIAEAMDSLVETALCAIDGMDEYGNPKIGPFYVQCLIDFDTDERVVQLANGRTLRSGSKTHEAGDYVRLCDKTGKELAYWDHKEWQEDPIVVMGAILNSTDLAEDENLPGVEAVCEGCGKPCEYNSEVCLCKKCEKEQNND